MDGELAAHPGMEQGHVGLSLALADCHNCLGNPFEQLAALHSAYRADPGNWLVLVEPNAEGYTELARDQVLTGVTRALPAFSNGMLYVRDATTLKCLDLRAVKR